MSDLDKNYMKTLFGLVKVPLYRQILDAIIIFCVLASGSYAFPQRLKVQNFQMFVQITIVVFLSKFAIYLGLNFLLRTICGTVDNRNYWVFSFPKCSVFCTYWSFWIVYSARDSCTYSI